MTVPEKIELPFLHADYQKDLCVLFCRWQLPVDLGQFRDGYKAVLQLAIYKEAHFWLHDLRLRNSSTADQKQWFTSTFAADLQRALGSNVFIAYLMSPLQHQQLLNDEDAKKHAVDGSGQPAICYYTNEHDALEWLQECRHRVAV